MAVNLNIGPLTTVFTPPASCLNVVTSAASSPFSSTYSLFVGHFGPYEVAQQNCYPPGAASIDFGQTNYYWSPGICPSGYHTACAYTTASFPASVTASLCCPLGFDCAYDVWPHVCSSIAAVALTNVFVLTGTAATLPAGYSLHTLEPSPISTVWNDGIPVAWAVTDLGILVLLGSTTTSQLKAALSTSLPIVSPTVSIPSSTSTTPTASLISTTPLASAPASSPYGPSSTLGSTPTTSSHGSTNPIGTSSSGSGSDSGSSSSTSGDSGSSPATHGPSSRSVPTSPLNNSTGRGSNVPAASVSTGGFFSGHRGKVRIALIVAIPIVGLAALIGIFFCFRRYDLSIRKRSPGSSDAKPPAVVRSGAEADSRSRYEIGTGETQTTHFPSELAGNVPYSKEE